VCLKDDWGSSRHARIMREGGGRHARRWLPFCQAMSANQTIIKIDAGASTVGGRKGETKL
jgi:hypothetical protein